MLVEGWWIIVLSGIIIMLVLIIISSMHKCTSAILDTCVWYLNVSRVVVQVCPINTIKKETITTLEHSVLAKRDIESIPGQSKHSRSKHRLPVLWIARIQLETSPLHRPNRLSMSWLEPAWMCKLQVWSAMWKPNVWSMRSPTCNVRWRLKQQAGKTKRRASRSRKVARGA